ncbi:hypothetical protein GCK72_019959 [Caenorhabditis remanei]|uniref:Uncharacterized protein n=1 Tax=Caenorhabditis remanei TaxID=31234 RepID=A0A6A5GFZ2_CAERE|nr:hypothetical protein GCK72_019959 [Caenorhabditis remanei]KAF1753402.1 hypothetical protein GCK72_019959 [Caenorhabditis remanei]
MPENGPTWQDLPDLFKRELVGYLDFKSRRQLRACSQNDKVIVDSCPLFIEKLAFFFASSKDSLYLTANTKMATKHSFNGTENTTLDLIQTFIHLFQHPKSTVKELTMEFSDKEKSEKLITEIDKVEWIFKMNAMKLIWYSCKNNLAAVQFVEYLTPVTLKTIRFEYQSENLEMMRKLVETEQWRQAQNLETSTIIPAGIDIEKFSHARRLKIKVRESEFDIEKIQNLILRFMKNDYPSGSYFSILTYFCRNDEESEADETKLRVPIVVHDRNIAVRTQTYLNMPNSNNFLLIRRSDIGVEGLVRDNDYPIEYFIL